ncbi:MAG: IS110 family transposase [bacterium]|nr:IS110 family transposase [bacterium]
MAKRRQRRKVQRKGSGQRGLRMIREEVAGIDLGSREHYVCGPEKEDGKPNVEVFGTTTPQLQALADWLAEQGVESVAMESTGVYWIPIYEVLENRGFEVLLVNARQLAHVPGRKTDMLDCQWIQLLHSCGLLKGSFRPAEPICRFRTLVRGKGTLVEERSDWLRRMQKCLDEMNVRVHRAVSDLSGATGMAIVRAIVAGERDPQKLAKLRDPRCRSSAAAIAEQLTGHWREDHLFALEHALQMYDFIQQQIERYEQELKRVLGEMERDQLRGVEAPELKNANKAKMIRKRGQEPMRQALYRVSGVDLTQVDGIGVEIAEKTISEYGWDLSMFPTQKSFVSHVLLAPRMNITGGKPMKKKQSTASTSLGKALRMGALTLQHSQSALGAFFRRMARRKGASVAVFATARKLAILIYRMLRSGLQYTDAGAPAYEKKFQAQRLRNLCHTAREMGYELVPSSEVPAQEAAP